MARRSMRKALVSALLAAAIGFLPSFSGAKDDSATSRVVGGVAIYFGVMPAEMVQGHPQGHPEATMHGGARAASGHRDHVVVALFDDSTGKRIEIAEVDADVMELGRSGQWKKLEPMRIAGTITYGNYFDFPSRDAYHIILKIRIPGRADVIETRFGHQHFGK